MTAQPTPADLQQLLLAGARADGVLNAQAAMHILVGTELPNAPGFARDHIKIEHHFTLGGQVRGAWIRSWPRLIADPDLTGTERRLIAIAASLASGRRVNLLAEVTMELGRSGAQLVAEAVLIAAGADKFLAVGPSADRRPERAEQPTVTQAVAGERPA